MDKPGSLDIVDKLDLQHTSAADTLEFFAVEVVAMVLAGEACPACESGVTKGEEWYSGLTEAVNEAERRERRDAGLPPQPWRELSAEEKQVFDIKLTELMSKHASAFIDVAFAGLYRSFGKSAVVARMRETATSVEADECWAHYRRRLTNAQRDAVDIPTGATLPVPVLVEKLCDALARESQMVLDLRRANTR